MACPCVSQAVCQSATTGSVVWPLALDFIFTQCVSPCPWNFNIGCCANEKPLRLIAHRRVRFFTFMFVSTLVLGKGGNSLNPIQASENIMILETNDCTSSVRAFFSAQGPGLSSKCSKEVLDRQLVSAVLRSSVRCCCTLGCMSCSCRLITSRSVTLARASSRFLRNSRLCECLCSLAR